MVRRMECHPMFSTVYISLILMTAGFVLTLCSWLAPPLNQVVDFVRIAGLASLLVGSIFLSLACIVGSFYQGRCFPCCYACETKRQPKGSFLAQSIENPFLTTAILGSTLCTKESSDQYNNEIGATSGTAASQSVSFDDTLCSALVIENKATCTSTNKRVSEKSRRKQEYELIPTSEFDCNLDPKSEQNDYNLVPTSEQRNYTLAPTTADKYDYHLALSDEPSFSDEMIEFEEGSNFISSSSKGKKDAHFGKRIQEESVKLDLLKFYEQQDSPPTYMSVAGQANKKYSQFSNGRNNHHGTKQKDFMNKPKSLGTTNPDLSSKIPFKCDNLGPPPVTSTYSVTNKGSITSTTFPVVVNDTNSTFPVAVNETRTTCPVLMNNNLDRIYNTSSKRFAKLSNSPKAERCRTTSKHEGYKPSISNAGRGRTQRKGSYDSPTFQGRTNSVQIKIYEKYDSKNSPKSVFESS